MVASMKPVTTTAPRRIPNSSGILRELVNDRFDKTINSIHIGFAKVGTSELGLMSLLAPAPETNLPLDILAPMASFSDKPCVGVSLPVEMLFRDLLRFCHDLLNSTKLLVPPGDPSSSLIKSSANSVRFSLSGIGWPKSEKYNGRFVGEPL